MEYGISAGHVCRLYFSFRQYIRNSNIVKYSIYFFLFFYCHLGHYLSRYVEANSEYLFPKRIIALNQGFDQIGTDRGHWECLLFIMVHFSSDIASSGRNPTQGDMCMRRPSCKGITDNILVFTNGVVHRVGHMFSLADCEPPSTGGLNN